MADKYLVVLNIFEYNYSERTITTDEFETDINNKVVSFDAGKKSIQKEYEALYEQVELKDVAETEEDEIRIREMDELEDILVNDDIPGNFVFRAKDKIYQWYLFELDDEEVES